MPGRSGRFTGIEVPVCLVAVAAYTVFGWRFGDGTSDPVAFAIALVAVAFAVVATLRERTE